MVAASLEILNELQVNLQNFLVILPPLLLLLAALAIFILHLVHVRPAFFWLVALSGAFPAWILTLIARTRLPFELTLVTWKPVEFFSVPIELLYDRISWTFVLAVTTLAISALFTGVANRESFHGDSSEWMNWASCLTITGISFLAVCSGNLLSLTLTWIALDLSEAAIRIRRISEKATREHLVITLSARLMSIFLLIWAGLVARSVGQDLSFTSINPQTALLLLLAAGLHLGVLPPDPFSDRQALPQRSLEVISRLSPSAAGLCLLARVSIVRLSPQAIFWLLVFISLAVFYTSLSWVRAESDLHGRGYWIVALSGLALAAGVVNQPEASLAWGLAAILPGGVLLLDFARFRWLSPIFGLCALCLTSLPLTPTWPGVLLYNAPFSLAMVLFLFSQAFLIVGYIRFALPTGEKFAVAERWIWVMYPLGLVLPTVTYLILAWWSQPPGGFSSSLAWYESWPGFAVSGLFILFALAYRSKIVFPGLVLERIIALLSFNWGYRIFWRVYQLIRRMFFSFNALLEGPAGVLWAFLLLILLVSLLSHGRSGG
jgi:hypothetical protein